MVRIIGKQRLTLPNYVISSLHSWRRSVVAITATNDPMHALAS